MNQTGPRTAAGKARSASNAIKHGFSAQRLVVPDELREDFERLERAFHQETDPHGVLETLAVNRAFHAAWNLRHIEQMESEILATSPNPLGDEATARQLDRLSRYHTRHERAYSRAMNELRRLQTDRALRVALPQQEHEEPLPVLATVSGSWAQHARLNSSRERCSP